MKFYARRAIPKFSNCTRTNVHPKSSALKADSARSHVHVMETLILSAFLDIECAIRFCKECRNYSDLFLLSYLSFYLVVLVSVVIVVYCMNRERPEMHVTRLCDLTRQALSLLTLSSGERPILVFTETLHSVTSCFLSNLTHLRCDFTKIVYGCTYYCTVRRQSGRTISIYSS